MGNLTRVTVKASFSGCLMSSDRFPNWVSIFYATLDNSAPLFLCADRTLRIPPIFELRIDFPNLSTLFRSFLRCFKLSESAICEASARIGFKIRSQPLSGGN
jgi:hypothetical protein